VDELLERITDFASDLRYDDLPANVVQAAKDRLVDSLGCAVGALGLPGGCPPADVGWRVASLASDPTREGRVIGTPDVLAADAAAFINGCLIRYLDFSDTYPGHHPSDALGGLLAVASATGASGRDLISAMTVSYEISSRLIKSGQFNRRGWDNGYSTGIGAAAAVARLMGLGRDQIRQAVAITATANMPLRATRSGQLSMWKGAATAWSVRDAVFAAQLSAEGMTGPEAPFTGRHGVMDLITGPMELDPFGPQGGGYLLPKVKMKYWPLVHNLQGLVFAGIDLREQLDGREPADIQVFTCFNAWRESGSEPEKWDPRTRETADHSAPYILAYVLRHGTIGHDAFDEAAYLDESLRPEMKRITVVADEDIEAVYPETIRTRVTATDAAGAHYESEIVNPRGHEDNPMSRADIEAKFARLCGPLLGEDRAREALRIWWDIEDRDAASGLDALVAPGQQDRLRGERDNRAAASRAQAGEE
jgi:2-methylcitrate dehydratase